MVIKYIVCRVCLEWLLSTLFVECVRVVIRYIVCIVCLEWLLSTLLVECV